MPKKLQGIPDEIANSFLEEQLGFTAEEIKKFVLKNYEACKKTMDLLKIETRK